MLSLLSCFWILKGGSGEFDWNAQTQGFILGAYAVGNFLTVFLGGILSERLGGKLIFGGGTLLACILGLFIPVAARTSPILLICVRALQGAFQGGLIPTFHNMAHKWFPLQEKNFLMTATIAGTKVCLFVNFVFSISGSFFERWWHFWHHWLPNVCLDCS